MNSHREDRALAAAWTPVDSPRLVCGEGLCLKQSLFSLLVSREYKRIRDGSPTGRPTLS